MKIIVLIVLLVPLSSIIGWSIENKREKEMIVTRGFEKEHCDIYTIDINGKNEVRLTKGPSANYDPSFSPNGTQIAFTSVRDGNEEIYIMDATGKNQKRLTRHPFPDHTPSFSPDGKKIIFTSMRDKDVNEMTYINEEIYIMDATGRNQKRLIRHPFSDYTPSFSPDGKKIVYVSMKRPFSPTDGKWNPEIYEMDTDGRNQRALTNHPGRDVHPSFSPNGKQILFESNRDDEWGEIYVMDVDGKNVKRLTTNKFIDSQPSWSPDGKKIVFRSKREGDDSCRIYIMDADGENQVRLTNGSFINDYSPSFSPNGSYIIFFRVEEEKEKGIGIIERAYLMRAREYEEFIRMVSQGIDIR